MKLWAYARSTSCVQGGQLAFCIGNDQPDATPAGRAAVRDAVDGCLVAKSDISGAEWVLDVGADWRSSLYLASFEPGEAPASEVYFAVRAARPASPIVLSVPFATWQAYNLAGVPGASLYWTESADRAAQVSFDRPGGGPPPEQWEAPMMRWLRESGLSVDYCSNLDLHADPDLLRPYRLLVIAGHDEYWSRPMREAVHAHVSRGGNVAIFGANTAWWQIRLADAGRTMICYRDALADPVVAAGHPELATVEWSSAPVSEPENSMTGLSYRLGAGCWAPDMTAMHAESYTARFADHWVFDGTGLADGDSFGRGCLGYETDAADIEEIGGVPRVTGRDGTPRSFTVLATADLRHWDAYGQGGAATMGVFTAGPGTVFNAGTVNWGAALADPVVARITSNVIARLTAGPPAGEDPRSWLAVGDRQCVTALAGTDSRLFAVLGDTGGLGDTGELGGSVLAGREACAQNLPWRPWASAAGITAIAIPRDAVDGGPRGIYAARSDGLMLRRPLGDRDQPWLEIGRCPARARSLAVAADQLFVLDQAGAILTVPLGQVPATAGQWAVAEEHCELIALTALNGRLVGIDKAGRLVSRLPVAGQRWSAFGSAGGCVVVAGHAGALYGAAPGQPLRRWSPSSSADA